MPTIRVEPGKIGITIRADARNLRKVLKTGARRGAARGRTHLVKESPVDRGVLRNAWKTVRGGDNFFDLELVNDALYAGVVERGMRPGFKMSPAGIEALAGWVRRKILKAGSMYTVGGGSGRGQKSGPLTPWQHSRGMDTYMLSMKIARAIATKFERYGRQGKFFVRNSLGKLTIYAVEEILREVNKYFAQGGGTRGNV